ncbi:MAG: hypothetical protein FWF59_00425 [Turicibacter sp.]|nr:hypothetical protein [Turicibacter sp.]
MSTELEIREQRRELLFEYLELRHGLPEIYPLLENKIARLRAKMMDEDKAMVEKEFNELYGDGAATRHKK